MQDECLKCDGIKLFAYALVLSGVWEITSNVVLFVVCMCETIFCKL